jgi:hypothetical protein
MAKPSLIAKIFYFPLDPNHLHIIGIPPTEGRCATSRNAGGDAVDAEVLAGRAILKRTAKACGPDTPMLVFKSAEDESAGDGDKKSPVTRESAP